MSQTSTNGFVAQSDIPGEGRINRCECPTFFGGVQASFNIVDSLAFMCKFQCASHMSVPVLGFLKQSNTGNKRLGNETRFPQQSSSSRNGKQAFNLFFLLLLVEVLFCRASRLLELKTHTPVLLILATKIHYPNIIHGPQQKSCPTLVGT